MQYITGGTIFTESTSDIKIPASNGCAVRNLNAVLPTNAKISFDSQTQKFPLLPKILIHAKVSKYITVHLENKTISHTITDANKIINPPYKFFVYHSGETCLDTYFDPLLHDTYQISIATGIDGIQLINYKKLFITISQDSNNPESDVQMITRLQNRSSSSAFNSGYRELYSLNKDTNDVSILEINQIWDKIYFEKLIAVTKGSIINMKFTA